MKAQILIMMGLLGLADINTEAQDSSGQVEGRKTECRPGMERFILYDRCR